MSHQSNQIEVTYVTLARDNRAPAGGRCGRHTDAPFSTKMLIPFDTGVTGGSPSLFLY